jgi:hypothetical protein
MIMRIPERENNETYKNFKELIDGISKFFN